MLLELLCSFSFEKLFYSKNSFIFWYLRHCNIESLPEKIFSNIFRSILSPELSNYDPWNSLLVCQFLNYLINKTIVLINQQLVNIYENNNLRLCGLQKFFKKLDLTWDDFFWNTYREHLRWLLLKVDMITASYLCMFLFVFFLNLWSYIDFCFWNSNQLAYSCWKSTMEIPKTMCEICVTLTKTIPERRQPLFPLKSSENLENLWFFDDSRGIEIDFVLLSYC